MNIQTAVDVCVHMYTYVNIQTAVDVCVCMHTYMNIQTAVNVCVHMYTYVNTQTAVDVHSCMYTETWLHKQQDAASETETRGGKGNDSEILLRTITLKP